MNLRNTLLGLKAIAPSKLKVVSLYNDDAFVNGCSSVWRNASPTKLLTFAPLCVSMAVASRFYSVRLHLFSFSLRSFN